MGSSCVDDDEHEIRGLPGALRPRHAFGFHDVGRVAQTRRVNERHFEALDVHDLRDQVPRRAGPIRHDRSR